MYRVLRPDKDAYITSRIVRDVRSHAANVGGAGSLDLYKLYGSTVSGSVSLIELSRLLIHYDLAPLRALVAAGSVDTNNPSFEARLVLFDVYGGQPTPSNFTVAVNPLSRSFDEGLGRDVVYYSDGDVCNFLTGSVAQGAWLMSGCGLGGGLPGTVDYITASVNVAGGADLTSTQLFVTGEEDLSVDVTTIVSATLAGSLPDEGFRIALDKQHEVDNRSYFVKRFAARTAYNTDKRPRLIVKYDDSVQDDTLSTFFDSRAYLFLRNYEEYAPANLISGSLQVTGSNCLILRMMTEVSGGWYELPFTGSQHLNGTYPVTGVYSASINLSSTNAVFAAKLAQTGSVDFRPVWGSLDGTVGWLTGSTITVRPPRRGSPVINGQGLIVTAHGLDAELPYDERTTVRVHVFDASLPYVKLTRLPIELPGAVVRDVHYQVRDNVTGLAVVPFDTVKNSTRLSSDARGMYFTLDASNLTRGRSYVIDVMILAGSERYVHRAVSHVFSVT